MTKKAEELDQSIEYQAEEIFRLIDESSIPTNANDLMTELNNSFPSEETTSISITLSNTTNAMIKYC